MYVTLLCQGIILPWLNEARLTPTEGARRGKESNSLHMVASENAITDQRWAHVPLTWTDSFRTTVPLTPSLCVVPVNIWTELGLPRPRSQSPRRSPSLHLDLLDFERALIGSDPSPQRAVPNDGLPIAGDCDSLCRNAWKIVTPS